MAAACGELWALLTRPAAPPLRQRGCSHSTDVSGRLDKRSWTRLPGGARAVPLRPPLPPAATVARCSAAAGASSAAVPPIVADFLEGFNQRSVERMSACLAPSATYHNLSYPKSFQGRQAVEGVLASLVAGAPPDWRLVVGDATCDGMGPAAAAAVVFHMIDGRNRVVPLSQGVAFYRLDEAGRIARITEASEQVFKVPAAALPAIGAAAPLLQALGSSPLGGLLGSGQAVGPAVSAPAAGGGVPLPPLYASGASRSGRSSTSGSGIAEQPGSLPGSALGRGLGSRAQEPLSSSSSNSRSSTTTWAGSLQAAAAAGAADTGGGPSSSPGPIAGVWLKDTAASDLDSYSRACDLMQLSGLQKTTAMQLIEGLEIEQRGELVCVRFLTVVPFFKVTEELRLGERTSMPRRDLRRGSQQAEAHWAADGSLQVSIAWGEPNAGGVQEEYRLIAGAGGSGDVLECMSTVSVAAGSVSTRTVYRRSGDGWRPRYQWRPLFGGM